jgi:hypothetical protein
VRPGRTRGATPQSHRGEYVHMTDVEELLVQHGHAVAQQLPNAPPPAERACAPIRADAKSALLEEERRTVRSG